MAEASLALAQYVTSYMTKAERGNMQDIWKEVSDSKSNHSHLFKFEICTLCSRECGLYEVSDILLGESLCKKSVTIMQMNVAMPHKRNRRLKDKKVLDDIFKVNPKCGHL